MRSRSIFGLPIVASFAALTAAAGCSSSPPAEISQATASADTGSPKGGFLSFGGQVGYGKCLDIEGDVIAKAVAFDSGNCNGTQAQSFVIDGTQIHPAQNTGYCVDLQNANYTPGVWIQLWPCNGLPNQQWTFQNGSIHSLGAAQAGKSLCLDVLGNDAASGAPVGMGTCNNSLEQLWFPFNFTVQLQSTETTGGKHECLDVWQDLTTTVGQPVDDYTCDVNSDRDDAQEFTFTSQGAITNHSLCLGFVPGSYNPLQMQSCNGAVQQHWQFAPGPNGTLNIQDVGGLYKCLDVPGNNATPGTVVDMTVCNDSSEQQWSPVITGTPCGGNGLVCCTDPAKPQCNAGFNCEQNVCDPCGTLGYAACKTGTACQTGLQPSSSGVCLPPPPPPPPSELTFKVSGNWSNIVAEVAFQTTVTVYPNGSVTWAPEMSNSFILDGYCYTLDINAPGYTDLLALNGIVGASATTFPPGPGPSAAASAWVKANYLSLQGATLGWNLKTISYGSSPQSCSNWWAGNSGATGSSAGSVCSGGGTYADYSVCCFCGSDNYSQQSPAACSAQAAANEADESTGCDCLAGTCPSPGQTGSVQSVVHPLEEHSIEGGEGSRRE